MTKGTNLFTHSAEPASQANTFLAHKNCLYSLPVPSLFRGVLIRTILGLLHTKATDWKKQQEHTTTQQTKQAQSQVCFWRASWLALAMATKNALIHLIHDTFSGVAPEPPIGRSSTSTPIHNKKASPMPHWLWACFLASPCHGHPQLSLFT